ncbi:hypothetical protein C943_01719 [Mariniradius saccharolyticus AK6]|uniref:Serine protease n=1 Tax=Mariniradius saccharolyticus AK6 TaxID=1239962 RepID=M7XAR1_9BACT|nr:NfeD family protein [Mariniradius saccharolyticus]EMS31984.1 hypothetical protein C943_01719 [Mariniradius saccharolyticus AK6]
MEMFNEMEPLLKVFWYIAIPSSLVFLIQMVMTFIGVDAGEGLEADFDGNLDDAGGPFQFFSFRNLINFLMGFGWAGVAFYQFIESEFLLVALAFLIGLGFVLIFFVIIKQLQRLAEDNTFKVQEALGKTAEVYLTVPAKRSGTGKIQISVKGTFKEMAAVTDFESIPTGALVKVKSIDSENILVVEKI